MVTVETITISADVAKTPSNFSPSIFSMIKSISETVIMPIAGIILTIIACYELIQLIIEHNNLANFETWIFLKWIFKTYVAVTIITHTSDITMAIFDVAQHVVAKAAGVVVSSASITATDAATLMETVNAMSNGSLLGLYLQTGVVMITQFVLSKIIFVIVYARMIEIYLITSLAPIPLATFGNKEQSQIGQNYLRSLAAVAFQGFLIIVCVGIYAVLVHDLAISTDISSSIWGIVGYTVLLCFSLFKTGTLAKSIFSAH
ncbi:MAG: hypothetical protein K6E95_08205 [Lachnospiraceae bacterium]|nr:hypothetical protein [Lachnospiraceae bacterium]